jgi:hypothetical protein
MEVHPKLNPLTILQQINRNTTVQSKYNGPHNVNTLTILQQVNRNTTVHSNYNGPHNNGSPPKAECPQPASSYNKSIEIKQYSPIIVDLIMYTPSLSHNRSLQPKYYSTHQL